MIQIRKSAERGHINHGWLDAFHSFSFGNYYDPQFLGFRDLLVINEDRVEKGKGFGRHGHRDMEIITYVLSGELEHKDSMGTGSVLRYGDVQRMSAGKGVLHSEFNHSQENDLHLFQIWIKPSKDQLPPSYEEKNFSEASKTNQLKLLVSPDGRDNSLKINQDAFIYASILESSKCVELPLLMQRHSWIQVASGAIEVNGKSLASGDGAAISAESLLQISAKSRAEFLIFDLQ